MIIRQRTCFDAAAHTWRKVVCIDIGRPETTAIPIEQHPAVIEDMTDGPTEDFGERVPPKRPSIEQRRGKPGARPYGQLESAVAAYLTEVGMAEAAVIAQALGKKRESISRILAQNPERFAIDHVVTRKTAGVGVAKTSVWRLR